MSTLLERMQYGFDRDSRRTWRRRTLTVGEDDAYGYDGLSQVVNAARGNLNLNATAIAGVPAAVEAWDYDPTGNWRGCTVEEDGSVNLDQSRVYDKGNRLTQIADDPNPILLDQVGRMLEVSPGADGDWSDSQQLTWDAWSRVTQVKGDDGTVLGSYSYDGLARRGTRTVGDTTTHCYYSDAWRPLEERKDEETTAAMQYYWGARHRDDLVRRDRATTDGGDLDETRYVLMDYFNPAAITDETGAVSHSFSRQSEAYPPISICGSRIADRRHIRDASRISRRKSHATHPKSPRNCFLGADRRRIRARSLVSKGNRVSNIQSTMSTPLGPSKSCRQRCAGIFQKRSKIIMRMTSLATDVNDQAKLRHGRGLHEGGTVGCEFYQACPFFFTREGAALSLVGLHRGRSVFLMAGGPSAGALDKAPLKRCWTMTLNNAHSSYRGQANMTVDDPSRFNLSMWLDPTIQKFVPMGQFEKPLWDNRCIKVDGEWRQQWEPAKIKVGDCPNVIGYRRNEKFHAPRWLYEDTINWGNHKKYGGGRSVMLAALRILFLIGFRRVYLLGVDFDMSPEKKYHFAEDRTKQAIRGNMETYAQLQGWFTELQPYFLQECFIVKNCNPQSKLTAFPFMPYDEALAEATEQLGDYTQERTSGMYRKYEEKLAELEQPVPKPKETTTATPAAVKPSVLSPHIQSDSKAGGRFLDPLLTAVEKAKVDGDPFCHLWMERIFPALLYQELLSNLPEKRFYEESRNQNAGLADGHSSRLQFRLEPKNIRELPDGQRELWRHFSEALYSPHLEQFFRQALDAGLAHRFGSQRQNVRVEPKPLLVREMRGYKIGVHPDIAAKVITAQFYLPGDCSQLHVGTSYYRKAEEPDGYKLAKRLPFRPNTGYAFAVTDHSFHGVDSIAERDGVRNSLILSYYLRS